MIDAHTREAWRYIYEPHHLAYRRRTDHIAGELDHANRRAAGIILNVVVGLVAALLSGWF